VGCWGLDERQQDGWDVMRSWRASVIPLTLLGMEPDGYRTGGYRTPGLACLVSACGRPGIRPGMMGASM